jgi:16S rRNA (cytosine1402-N4)-methyltransferase
MPDFGSRPHQPVLYQEVLRVLKPFSPGRYIDATTGAGGHAWGILDASAPEGQLLGFDLDPVALALAGERLAEFGGRAVLRQTSYVDLLAQMQSAGWSSVNGVLLDLGVSSMQLDRPEKGFSFREEGPLDMRFDPRQEVTAADLVNKLPAEELANILWRYGEERASRRIAGAIAASRPLHTTTQLVEVIRRAVGWKRGAIHPATLTFQALRIAVNQELQAVESVLPDAVQALEPGGRLAVIAFHSLEDRLVKQFFQRESRDCICPPGQPVCTCNHKRSIKIVQRLYKPTEAEVEENPRARSARLRAAEKIEVA